MVGKEFREFKEIRDFYLLVFVVISNTLKSNSTKHPAFPKLFNLINLHNLPIKPH